MKTKEKLTESQISILSYLYRQPSSIKGYWPEATTNRGATLRTSDWGEGRTPQALHSLVRKGFMTNGNYTNPVHYGYFELTPKALDWCEKNGEILKCFQEYQDEFEKAEVKKFNWEFEDGQ